MVGKILTVLMTSGFAFKNVHDDCMLTARPIGENEQGIPINSIVPAVFPDPTVSL